MPRPAFIDAHLGVDSWLHRRDPRSKLIATITVIMVVASTYRWSPWTFGGYYLLLAILAGISRLPWRFWLVRLLAVTPFVVMAGALPAFSALLAYLGGETPSPGLADARLLDRGLLVLARAYAAVILLALLVGTTRFAHLLWALRKLHFPDIVNLIATMMYRHLFLLWDEWQRMERARRCRAPVLRNKLSFYANQVGLVFLRAWERAERVHAAMESRGFSGSLPLLDPWRFQVKDFAFVLLCSVAFLLIRWWL